MSYTSVVERLFLMISTYDICRQEDIPGVVAAVRSAAAAPPDVLASVERIVETVKEGGDEALLEMTLRFDGVNLDPGHLEVADGDRRAAWNALPGDTRNAMRTAAERIAWYARRGLAPDWRAEVAPGVVIGQCSRPLDPVGIYVPGGRFEYPSTVLMTGVLAREAGARRIIFCMPPGDPSSEPAVALAATTLVGDCRVFRVGGAQAIAAMAYGTETIPACGMIAGPGNVYVATAKRLVSDMVKVDLEAGPSEVAILADETCDVSFAAADMAAQLEHDPHALAVIVSESRGLLEKAGSEVSAAVAEFSGDPPGRSAAVLVWSASREVSVEFLNALAPEHLELMVSGPEDVLPLVTSAGCVFLGNWSAVALGDYVAGPSHVLPTGGSASRLSGLRADDFRKTLNTVAYTEKGFVSDAKSAMLLAGLEGLSKHKASLEIRDRRAGGVNGA